MSSKTRIRSFLLFSIFSTFTIAACTETHGGILAPELPPAHAVMVVAESLPVLGRDTTISIGDRFSLEASGATGRRLSWTSSDPSVVTVSAGGEVVARSAGKATLSTLERSYLKDLQVTVKPTGGVTNNPVDSLVTPPELPTQTSGLPADWSVGAAQVAELPRAQVDTVYPVRTGRVLRVPIGKRIQPALDSARYGDEILLAAGGTWTESITLPAKSGSGWIVVRTEGALPPSGRIQPSSAVSFAKILAPNNNTSAVLTAPGAAGWRLVGLEIGAAPAVTSLNSLMRVGDAAASAISAQPDRIVLDRLYIHGRSELPLVRCVQLHARAAAIVDSYITECHHAGQDSQAIVGWNGPGPYLIDNNYLAGAGENIMFGGAKPSIPGLLPADITISRNHITKPVAWRNKWLVKTLVELKFGRRVLLEGNVIENVWAHGQVGNALVIKSSWTAGMDWAETRDVTIRSNIVRNAAFGGISLSARPDGPAVPLSRVTIVNNFFWRLGAASDYATSGGRGVTVTGGVAHILIAYNTITSSDMPIGLWSDGNPPLQQGFTLRGNVIERGVYGVWGSGGEGTTTINNRYSTSTVQGNVFFGSAIPAGRYPAGTVNILTRALLFPGWNSGDLQLGSASGVLTSGPGGTLPGVQWTTLNSATRFVVR